MRPIKTKKDYELALKRIENLMDAKENTPEANDLDVLALLVEAYEEKHFPIDDARLNKYIICGASRAGKSILSERLSRQQNANWILGDALVSSFQDAFPQIGISHHGDLNTIGDNFEEFTKYLLWNYAYAKVGYVFDSTHLYPHNVINMRNKIGDIPTVFLGYPSINPQEKLAHIREHDPSENWWTRDLPDDELLKMINAQIEKSRHLEMECKKFELLFIDVSENFEKKLSEAFEILMGEK